MFCKYSNPQSSSAHRDGPQIMQFPLIYFTEWDIKVARRPQSHGRTSFTRLLPLTFLLWITSLLLLQLIFSQLGIWLYKPHVHIFKFLCCAKGKQFVIQGLKPVANFLVTSTTDFPGLGNQINKYNSRHIILLDYNDLTASRCNTSCTYLSEAMGVKDGPNYSAVRRTHFEGHMVSLCELYNKVG